MILIVHMTQVLLWLQGEVFEATRGERWRCEKVVGHIGEPHWIGSELAGEKLHIMKW